MTLFHVFLGGLCMGVADLIPGISGGTIAFILGFYPRLLESLRSFNGGTLRLLLKGKWNEFCKKTSFSFLCTLLAGIAAAILSLSGLIDALLSNETSRVYLYASFFGLILASFFFCLKQIKTWGCQLVILLLIGMGLAQSLTFTYSSPTGTLAVYLPLEGNGKKAANYDEKSSFLNQLFPQDISLLIKKNLIQPDDLVWNERGQPVGYASDYLESKSSWLDVWLIICGSLAMCALLLPGLSGSYILTLLGVYPLVIGALSDFTSGLMHFHLQGEALAVLLNLLSGILLGGLLFSKLVSFLLKFYPNASLALLSGFMLGAIRSVWPFWSTHYAYLPQKLHKGPQLILEHPIMPLDFTLLGGMICLLAGFGLVFLLETTYKKRTEERAHGLGQ